MGLREGNRENNKIFHSSIHRLILRFMLVLILVLIVIALNLIVVIYTTSKVNAEPSGANITKIQSSRKQAEPPQSLDVQAGNVTEINIYATSITQSWAGFYGNVTGTIVLADSSNNTFYDWSVSSPQGEVYASRASSITWANVQCASASEISTENTNLNMNQSSDNITNTFNQQSHPGFYVGAVDIAANSCKSTNAYNESGNQTSMFYNLLLSDGVGNIIYTSLLEQDAEGFDNRTHDFELLVGEDGHASAGGSTTTYYFWVEIE